MHSVIDFFRSDAWFNHQSCNIEDFSCQLRHQEKNKKKKKEKLRLTALRYNLESNEGKVAGRRQFLATLQTTLMPSMSSPERILICDVPFRNCSDSETPVLG